MLIAVKFFLFSAPFQGFADALSSGAGEVEPPASSHTPALRPLDYVLPAWYANGGY